MPLRVPARDHDLARGPVAHVRALGPARVRVRAHVHVLVPSRSSRDRVRCARVLPGYRGPDCRVHGPDRRDPGPDDETRHRGRGHGLGPARDGLCRDLDLSTCKW